VVLVITSHNCGFYVGLVVSHWWVCGKLTKCHSYTYSRIFLIVINWRWCERWIEFIYESGVYPWKGSLVYIGGIHRLTKEESVMFQLISLQEKAYIQSTLLLRSAFHHKKTLTFKTHCFLSHCISKVIQEHVTDIMHPINRLTKEESVMFQLISPQEKKIKMHCFLSPCIRKL